MKNFQNKAKIIKVSKILRSILFAVPVVWIIAFTISILGFLAGILIPFFSSPKNGIDSSRIYETGGVILFGIFAFIVTLKLFRFFDRLKNGHLFDSMTVGNLDSAGKWWIFLWLYQGLYSEIGRHFFQSKLTWDSGGLVAGLALIFVAWLLREAQELQEEQELTV